ncbi:MAG TPA: molybdopterin cofactor-binding domain-containing protein, partial [Thermoplasmata archaeon]|nr:molybdopterin cofactor-binding domain-containing protein [Thermoplasmata archaeon]
MTAPRGSRPFDLDPPSDRRYFERLGNGLVVVLPPQRPGADGWGSGGPPHGGAWLHIGEDGRVRAFTGKVEVGQGTRTALTLLVAEELRLPVASVDLTMGDTDASPWDMGTFGSRSMPDAGEHLRSTGAAARSVLLELAAERLGVRPEGVLLSEGRAGASGAGAMATVGYGDLVRGLRRVELVTSAARPTPPTEWTRAGESTGNLGARDIVTGAQTYTSDLRPEGMLHGKVLFPPTFGAKLVRVDLTGARAVPGTVAVREGDLVAVAAPDLLGAHDALRRVRVEWESTPQPSESGIIEYLRQHPEDAEDSWDVIRHRVGDVEAALAAAPVTLEATYTTAYIAHVPMETHAVLASWEGERLTVAMGGQTPFRAREALAEALGRPPSDVRVTVPATGSGFGGKHASELAVAAAHLAKASGRPVRIVYSREEEFSQAYFRPMAVITVRSGAETDGRLTAWRFHDLNAGAAGARLPYRVPNQQIDNQPCASPLAQGPYRAIAATSNNFARESHIDEIAARVGADPIDYRSRHLADERLAEVLRTVADRAGWEPRASPSALGDGRGRGVAIGLEKGGRVATFVEVRVPADRRVEIVRIVTGFECGAIVHPANLRSQVEGGTVMALGGALFEAI